MNPFRLCPGQDLLHDGSQHPCLELGLSLGPATLINLPLGARGLAVGRTVRLDLRIDGAGHEDDAAHGHDLTTVGQRAQRGIEESAAHGGQHHVDASTIRQSEQRCSDVLCGVVHTRFGAQLPTALHTLIGACAGENSGP